jgi:regulator of RNase E activity RraA
MRASAPPISGRSYFHRADWWEYCASVPGPKIIVVEDLDRAPGIGALFGEIHARIGRALGCVGYLTNGTIRDVGALETLGFQCFASGACVSHSYAHIVEFGGPVNIGGLKISTGDLLHGDLNGIHSIPADVIDRLPAAVENFEAREARFIELCQDRDFSLEKLKQAIRDAIKSHPRPEFH